MGYFVKRTIRVTLKDPAKFENAISDILEAGSNHIDGIVQFQTSRLQTYQDKARATAVADALKKAEAGAAALGRKVGTVTKIEEPPSWLSAAGCGLGQLEPTQCGVRYLRGDGKIVRHLHQPGMITVSAKLIVTFELE